MRIISSRSRISLMVPAGNTNRGTGRKPDEEPTTRRARSPIWNALQQLAGGEADARGELIDLTTERMRQLAHRMLGRFPVVRRWNDTDDIVQAAALRLWRALEVTVPETPRGLAGLMTTQIRRELLDLARKYSRPGSFASNHDSGGDIDAGTTRRYPEDPGFLAEQLGRWTRLHEAAAALPDESRELFHLAWYAGLRQDEIAAVLGVSLRTVKRRWEATKDLLRQVFPDALPD